MRGIRIGVLYSIKDRLSGGLNRIKQRMGRINELQKKARLASGDFFRSFGGKIKAAVPRLDAFKMKNVQLFEAIQGRFPMLARLGPALANPYVIALAAVAALTIGLAKATLAAADFNHEFLEIRQLNLDKSADSLNDYRDLVLDTAFTTGRSAKEMSKAFFDIQSATGLFGDDVEQIASKVGVFSKVTKADLPESVNATVKAMKTFGFGVKEVDRFLESQFKTVQVGITTFNELAAEQTEFSGAAKAAGQDFNTANKIFASFTAIAKNTRIAATLTKSAFEGITQKATLEGLEKIGVSLFDADGKTRDLDKVIRELIPKMQQLSDQEFLKWRNAIGGPEGLQMLFNQLRTSGQDVIKTMNAFDESAFSLDKAVSNAKNDFVTIRKEIANKINVILIKIGNEILPAATRALRLFSRTLDFVKEGIERIIARWKGMITLVRGLGMAFQRLIDMVDERINKLFNALGGKGNIWEAMFEGIDRWAFRIRVFFQDIARLAKLSADIALNAFNQKELARLTKELVAFRFRDADALFEARKKQRQQEAALAGTTAAEEQGGAEATGAGAAAATDSAQRLASRNVQQRNVTVNIQNLNEGGITVNSASAEQGSPDVEAMFVEMLIRAVRNAEQVL